MDTACLVEETILAFCRGTLVPADRKRAEAHLSTCDECRALVSALARSSIVDDAERAAYPSTPLFADTHQGFVTPIRASSPSASVADPMGPTTPVKSDGGAVSSPPLSPVAPGDVLAGKYLVERVLGAGGMGIVVAAKHTQLEQRVALKFLLPQACAMPGSVERFLREGKAAARITGEHVARVLDTGTLDTGAPYLVMEYLEGSDLGRVLEQRGRFTPSDAVDYVLQACEAIVVAHGLGIVHRDLKPANLFLTKSADGEPLVKVLDFGISKVDTGGQPQLTSSASWIGSPRYMSPEQMLSAKDVDARTDIWALGVILFELVSGQPVWEADTAQGLCALVATARAPRLREILPYAPEALDEVISRCLEKNPAERIPSVADLAIALASLASPSAQTSIERIVKIAGRVVLPTQRVPAPSAATHELGTSPPAPVIGALPAPPPAASGVSAGGVSTHGPRATARSTSIALLAVVAGAACVIAFVLVRERPVTTPTGAALAPPMAASSLPAVGASAEAPAASAAASSAMAGAAAPAAPAAPSASSSSPAVVPVVSTRPKTKGAAGRGGAGGSAAASPQTTPALTDRK